MQLLEGIWLKTALWYSAVSDSLEVEQLFELDRLTLPLGNTVHCNTYVTFPDTSCCRVSTNSTD